MDQRSIYLISDGGYLRKRGTLVDSIVKALEGGNGSIRFVQLREQNVEAARQAGVAPATDSEVVDIARRLLPACKQHRARLIMSRRIDLAKETGAHGVHLGQTGPSLEEARSELGSSAVIGYSAHSVEKIKEISAEDYSYALLSPIFKPFSKEIGHTPLGLKPLHEACLQSSIPIFALGGISTENAASCFKAGAKGVAAISAILFAPDTADSAKKFARVCQAA